MTNQEAIKEAEIQIDMYETFILYNKDFEPENDNSNYENKIDFLKTAIEALEKQIPKKPINISWTHYHCPICKKSVNSNYCGNCGQAIDWSEVE